MCIFNTYIVYICVYPQSVLHYIVPYINFVVLNMYWGNLSEDEYGTQLFLADLRFESVTVEIELDTNDLYNIRSNHYGSSRI